MDIHVGRYSNPQDVGYEGWIEPDDRSWIMFVDVEQKPVMFLNREQCLKPVDLAGRA